LQHNGLSQTCRITSALLWRRFANSQETRCARAIRPLRLMMPYPPAAPARHNQHASGSPISTLLQNRCSNERWFLHEREQNRNGFFSCGRWCRVNIMPHDSHIYWNGIRPSLSGPYVEGGDSIPRSHYSTSRRVIRILPSPRVCVSVPCVMNRSSPPNISSAMPSLAALSDAHALSSSMIRRPQHH
jgi:hypothetical protein